MPFHGAGPAQFENLYENEGRKHCFEFLPALLFSLKLSISISLDRLAPNREFRVKIRDPFHNS